MQLKVRAALMPEVMSAVEALEAQSERSTSEPYSDTVPLHTQLKVRAALMPEVVSAVEALEAQAGAPRKPEYVGAGGRPRQRSWAVSPKLFPCELSSEAKTAISEVCHRLARLLCSAAGLQDLATCGRTQAACFGG